MSKPIVEYQGTAIFEDRIYGDAIVEVAHVFAIGHPVLGSQAVRTSVVVEKHNNGDFETLNTFYRKEI